MASGQAASKPLQLQRRDIRLIAEIFLNRAMRRSQIIDLGFFGSVGRANARLLRLTRAGLLRRVRLPIETNGQQFVYRAGTGAARILAEDLQTDEAAVLRRLGQISPLCLAHTLRIVDVRLAIQRAVTARGLTIAKWLPELLCRHEYETRTGSGAWRAQVLKPDAYVEISAGGRSWPHFVEVDLGHVSASRFVEKLQGYGRYLSSGIFEESYGASAFDVLVVTTGEGRGEHLGRLDGVSPGSAPRLWVTTFSALGKLGVGGPIWRGSGSSAGRLPAFETEVQR